MSIGAEFTSNGNASCPSLLVSELPLFVMMLPTSKLAFAQSHVDHSQVCVPGSHQFQFPRSFWSREIRHVFAPSLNFRHPRINLRSFHYSIIAYRFQSVVNLLRVVLLFHYEFDDIALFYNCGMQPF
jgi:hypothetical protein